MWKIAGDSKVSVIYITQFKFSPKKKKKFTQFNWNLLQQKWESIIYINKHMQ